MEDSLDEVQAMNTALSFLCRINADSEEVERYISRYPESLLFEGTQPEESSRFIVEGQMRNCQCFISACNDNRRRVLAVLKKGFEYYREIRLVNPSFYVNYSVTSTSNWQFYADQLRKIERDIREMRMQDMALRNRILEANVDLRTFQFELETVSRQENSSKSALSLLACRRTSDIFARRSVLEYKLGIATFSMSSLEKEQAVVDQEMLADRRMQLALLMNAFGGCRRHICEASKKDLV
jgi:hypothetical protein